MKNVRRSKTGHGESFHLYTLSLEAIVLSSKKVKMVRSEARDVEWYLPKEDLYTGARGVANRPCWLGIFENNK